MNIEESGLAAEIKQIFFTFISLAGLIVAGFVGVMTAHKDHPNGFSWLRVLRDTPWVILAAVTAGAIGQYFNLPPLIQWAATGWLGYFGPQFAAAIIKDRLEHRNEPNDPKDA